MTIQKEPLDLLAPLRVRSPGLSEFSGPLRVGEFVWFGKLVVDPSVTGWSTNEAGRLWYNTTDKVFRYWDGAAIQTLHMGASGATTFLELSDTPDSYSGQGTKLVRVKADASGLEFVTAPAAAPTPGDTVVSETSAGQSPAAGSASAYSRSDHTHGTPSAPSVPSAGDSVVSETSFDQDPAAGAAATFSRSDHTHGTPPDPAAIACEWEKDADGIHYPKNVGPGGDSFYGLLMTDIANERVTALTKRKTDMSRDSGVTTFGGTALSESRGICVSPDGTIAYIADSANNRILAVKVSDLSLIWAFGSYGTGNDQFNYPVGIATDGTYLYVTDKQNSRIKKHLCSDGSYVAKTTTNINVPVSISYADGYLYITQSGYYYTSYSAIRMNPSDLSITANYANNAGDGHVNDFGSTCILVYGPKAYIVDYNQHMLHRYALSPFLTWEASYGSYGTGNDQFMVAGQPGTDGVYIYVPDAATDFARLKKHLLSDFSYVAQVGHWGTPYNSEEMYYPWAVCCITDIQYQNVGIGQESETGYRLSVNGKVKATDQIKSTLASGTKPLDVTSPTKCDNLNADMVDGKHDSDFAAVSHNHDSAYGALANTPTPDQKAALAGTAGTPGAANKYVTGADARNSNARPPMPHKHIASDIPLGVFDGDRLPAISATKKSGVPAAPSPSGKFLKDDGSWDTPAGASAPATTVTDERPWGITPAVGTSANYARADHTHGSPANPGGGGGNFLVDQVFS